jgi:hypothetical protein
LKSEVSGSNGNSSTQTASPGVTVAANQRSRPPRLAARTLSSGSTSELFGVILPITGFRADDTT